MDYRLCGRRRLEEVESYVNILESIHGTYEDFLTLGKSKFSSRSWNDAVIQEEDFTRKPLEREVSILIPKNTSSISRITVMAAFLELQLEYQKAEINVY